MRSVSIRMTEWETKGPDAPSSALRDVHLLEENDRLLAVELKQRGILEVLDLADGIAIRALAHVGRVRIGPLDITIEPKLGKNDLLHLVRYAFGLDQLKPFDSTTFDADGNLFQDLLVKELLEEVAHLVQRGLSKRYVARSERLANPRGRIDMADLTQRIPMTEASLACRYHARLNDHLLNRVVLAGVRMAAEMTEERSLRRPLSLLRDYMSADIASVPLDFHMLARAVRSLDRMTTRYTSVLRLIELLLDGRALSFEDGATLPLRGFLFDMNRFFEALLGKFLSENLRGFQVQEQARVRDMMRYAVGHNPNNRQAPTPRPDFVVTEGNKIVRILDAKYRDLWSRELPRDMLYQLAIYAMSQPAPFTSAILYPTENSKAQEARIDIADPMSGHATRHVVLRPVVLTDLVRAIGDDETGFARMCALKYAGLLS